MNKFKNLCRITCKIILLCLIFGVSVDFFTSLFFSDEISLLLAMLILFIIYKILFNNSQNTKSYYIGTIILKAFIVIFAFIGGISFSTDYLFSGDMLSLLIGIGVGYLFYRYLFKESIHIKKNAPYNKNTQDTLLPPLSQYRQQIYQESGLTNEEISFFRQELAKIKHQLITIEDNFENNTKLTAIARRNNLIAILHDYFKELADNPKRLNEGTNFLYSYVPSLHDLTEKYIEINNHVSKTQLTYRTLDETAEIIDQLCHTIEEDYLAFQKEDLHDAEIEIALAKQKIKKANATESSNNVTDVTYDSFKSDKFETDDFENSFDDY